MKTQKDINRLRTFMEHIKWWAIFFSLYLLIFLYERDFKDFVDVYLHWGIVISFPFYLSTFYIFYGLIVPRAFKKKNAFYYGALFLATTISITIFKGVTNIIISLIVNDFNLPTELQEMYFRFNFFGNIFILISLYAVAGSVAGMVSMAYKEESKKNHLETEKLKSELAFLRSQVNPHFLFNSLNNIYTLVYKKKDQASDSLMKLSEILRYMLYECNEDLAPLSKEIKYLKDFLDLQKLRFDKNKKISFEVLGNDEAVEVPPMLFIPFLENAFKHGDNNGPVNVYLEVDDSIIHFRIINHISNKEISKDDTKGIGIQNVERRLELLYPGKYKLQKTEENNHFTIDLTLEIN